MKVLIESLQIQEEAPLITVRLRVVKLLGRLGGKMNRNLITGKNLHPTNHVWTMTMTLTIIGDTVLAALLIVALYFHI